MENLELKVDFEVVEKGDVKVLKAKDAELYLEKIKEFNPNITKKLLKEIDKFNDMYLEAGLELGAEKAKEMFVNGEAERVQVELPFGINKSDKVTYDFLKEKEFHVPGKDEKIKKSVVKPPVITKHGCKISKSKIKALEEDLSSALGLK